MDRKFHRCGCGRLILANIPVCAVCLDLRALLAWFQLHPITP